MASQPYRVNYRIKSSDNLPDELNRLARIISRKYKKNVRIYLEEMKGGR